MGKDTSFRSFTFWQRALRFLILIWVSWLFSDNFYIGFIGVRDYKLNQKSIPIQTVLSIGSILAGIILVIFSYLIFIYWFTHFALPIKSSSEKKDAYKRLLLFGLSMGRGHGPAIFVRNGETLGTLEEFSKKLPGVAFLDLRSAMVLEKLRHEEDKQYSENLGKPKKVRFSKYDSEVYQAPIRVAGPGLVFIEKNENITGTVDLRNQSRSRSNVTADTRDGIRVSTSVSCGFTLGQIPDILDVCLDGEKMDRVFVIEWDKQMPANLKKISRLTEELDPRDAVEISKFVVDHPKSDSVKSDLLTENFPFTFDAERVEQAIYSTTNVQGMTQPHTKTWVNWPEDIATEIFRILLSQKPLMSLYAPEDTSAYPMKAFRKDFFIKVRNTGVLAYRAFKRLDGASFKTGETYLIRDLISYPPRCLIRSDVLRDRGIKVISAGFGELEPKDKSVRNRLMESWLSSKQKEVEMKRADYKLEAERIINHARVRTQQSMIYHFTKLLEKQEYPREALAMLIYQELEAAAANPETRRLLPDDTLSLLTGIGQLLLPNMKGFEKPDHENPTSPSEDIK